MGEKTISTSVLGIRQTFSHHNASTDANQTGCQKSIITSQQIPEKTNTTGKRWKLWCRPNDHKEDFFIYQIIVSITTIHLISLDARKTGATTIIIIYEIKPRQQWLRQNLSGEKDWIRQEKNLKAACLIASIRASRDLKTRMGLRCGESIRAWVAARRMNSAVSAGEFYRRLR